MQYHNAIKHQCNILKRLFDAGLRTDGIYTLKRRKAELVFYIYYTLVNHIH